MNENVSDVIITRDIIYKILYNNIKIYFSTLKIIRFILFMITVKFQIFLIVS